MWRNLSAATTRLAIRRLMAGYFVISGLALFFPHRPSWWPILMLLHALAVVLLLQPRPVRNVFARLTARRPTIARVVGDWYPLVLVPALYTELAPLNIAVFNGQYFDSIILRWEATLFGGQPFRDMAEALPNLLISEFLHFSYISYYLIIYGPPIYLYVRGQRELHQQAVFTVMLTFFAHYVFFIYFPVQGPRYLFPAPGGDAIADGFFRNLAHTLLESGSSRGAAFPSSHVGVAMAQTAFAFRAIPRVAPFLLVLTIGLAFGAVYGGFHYATDAAVGFAYGLVLFALAPIVARLLAPNVPK